MWRLHTHIIKDYKRFNLSINLELTLLLYVYCMCVCFNTNLGDEFEGGGGELGVGPGAVKGKEGGQTDD